MTAERKCWGKDKDKDKEKAEGSWRAEGGRKKPKRYWTNKAKHMPHAASRTTQQQQQLQQEELLRSQAAAACLSLGICFTLSAWVLRFVFILISNCVFIFIFIFGIVLAVLNSVEMPLNCRRITVTQAQKVWKRSEEEAVAATKGGSSNLPKVKPNGIVNLAKESNGLCHEECGK